MGEWSVREGILLRLDNEMLGRHGFGEVAILPEFGTETLTEAISFLEGLNPEQSLSEWRELADKAPPATGFALFAAMSGPLPGLPVHSAALLSDLRQDLKDLRRDGYQTFKVKLGARDPEDEWKDLKGLAQRLQTREKLRLDPNRSWDSTLWEFWKSRLSDLSGCIEFLEEPFPAETTPDQWLQEARESPVPLALDESLTPESVGEWIQRGWPGWWIIKPSLMGPPQNWLLHFSSANPRVVISSVFETGIGLNTLLKLGSGFAESIHGLGTQSFFNDTLVLPQSGPVLKPGDRAQLEEIWKQSSGT